MNQANLKRVILPAASSASSGDLRPDVSDVRSDVTTKIERARERESKRERDLEWCSCKVFTLGDDCS